MPAGPREATARRYRLDLDRLEERELPASFTATPVIPTIDSAMTARLATVIQTGQANGNRANVFTRAGDSITYSNQFLVPLATASAAVDRAGDGSLNDTLGYFRSGFIGSNNSFANPSTAAYGGWTSSDVLARLPNELATSRPAFVLIMVGTNDITLGVSVDTYRQNLTRIVQTALNAGVVPVLSTIPDIALYPSAQSRLGEFNQAVQDVGESLQVPVWNYWRALQRLPDKGLSADGVHPSASPNGGGDLTAFGLNYGYDVRNLTALQTLDKLRRVLLVGQSPDLPAQNTSWAPLTNATAVAAGDTTGFQIQILDLATRKSLLGMDAFDGFRGGVRVAVGDVSGDGVPDLVAVVGSGGPAHVKVFDGTNGQLRASFLAFDSTFTGGLSVAIGDVDGNGVGDIVVAPAANGPGHVKVFTGAGQQLRSFYAFDPGFVGGVQVAAADVNRDGAADLIASAGVGGHGHTVVYSGASGRQLASFLPFGSTFGGTVTVAAGDFSGTGVGDVAIGVASGADPHVAVFRLLTGTLVGNFYAYTSNYSGGLRLGTATINGRTTLLSLSNTASITDVRRFNTAGAVTDQFFLYEQGFSRGAAFGN